MYFVNVNTCILFIYVCEHMKATHADNMSPNICMHGKKFEWLAYSEAKVIKPKTQLLEWESLVTQNETLI